MLRAGVEGLAEGADGAGLPAPIALAVTVLTTDADAPAALLRRAGRASPSAAGCGGVVCAAADIATIRAASTPTCCASRPASGPPAPSADDQARVATPAAGDRAPAADLLVVGRAVTAADDPAAAAAAIARRGRAAA